MFANTLLTSDQWLMYLNGQNKWHITVIEHAGGWNAHNLHYEWYEEKITLEEFNKRLQGSMRHSERKADRKKKGLPQYEFHP